MELGTLMRAQFSRASLNLAASKLTNVEHLKMALLPILEFPDTRLRTIAKPVTQFDGALQTLIDNMLETMYEAPGIGLAATQVDQHIQLIVIDISEEKNAPLVFINPVLSDLQGAQVYKEGCLSVPEVYAEVKRADSLRVQSLDRFGKPQTLLAEGLLAVCIQHEMDHLLGKVFVDYLSMLKRQLAIRKLERFKRERIALAKADVAEKAAAARSAQRA
jgi:peptide deformylase